MQPVNYTTLEHPIKRKYDVMTYEHRTVLLRYVVLPVRNRVDEVCEQLIDVLG